MKTSLREHHTDKDFGPLFGEVLRDEGIAKVTEHNENWMDLAIREVERFTIQSDEGGEGNFTGEDIRFWCSRTIGCPHHPNAWGALTNTLLKRKIIKPTGEWRKMRDDRSHARKTPVYTK